MNWVRENWLVSLLMLVVVVLAATMVALILIEKEKLGTPVGLGILAFSIVVVAFLILILKRPDKITAIRINLIWLSTLVAILTAVFGTQLMKLIMSPPNGKDTNTLEIVLSSLVGVGIGGLIAIAGQLVQDSGQDSKGDKPPGADQGSNA